MIRVVFFDGCGTLWYPRRTARRENPFWIYQDPRTAGDPDRHLVLTPGAQRTLQELGRRGVLRVLLSTSPHPPERADPTLRRRVAHFGLQGLLDEVHATRDEHPSKGEFIRATLGRRGIPAAQALMVGDRFVWDYQPARDVGVRALLLVSDYEQQRVAAGGVESITEVDEVLGLL